METKHEDLSSDEKRSKSRREGPTLSTVQWEEGALAKVRSPAVILSTMGANKNLNRIMFL